MTRQVLTLILIALLVATGVGVLHMRTTPSATTASSSPNPTSAPVIDPADTVDAVTATGTIQANQTVALAFPLTGRVTSIAVQQGDHVLKGQLIATLDNQLYMDAVLLAQTKIDSANIILQRLTDKPRQVDIDAAQAAVNLAKAQLDEALHSVDPLNAQIAQAGVSLANNDLYSSQVSRDADNQQRPKLLANPQTAAQANQLPSNDADNAAITSKEYNVQVAQANLDAAQTQSGNSGAIMGAQAQLTTAQNALTNLLKGGNDQDIARAQDSLHAAQTSLDQAVSMLDKTTLVAPFDGVIAKLYLNLGEQPKPGPAAILLDTSSFYVDLPIPEIDIARVALGQHVDLRIAALPGKVLAGTVTRIAQTGDNTNGLVTYQVRVTILPTDEPLLSSMTTTATIITGQAGTASPATQSSGAASSPAPTSTALPSLTPTASGTPIVLYTPIPYTSTYAVGSSSACVLTASTTLSLRGDPSVNQQSIGRVTAGSLLHVIGRSADDKWWSVLYVDGDLRIQGWVSTDYVTANSACTDQAVPVVQESSAATGTPAATASGPCTLTVSAAANLRPDPSIAHDPVASIPANTTLTPSGKSVNGLWWHVSYNNLDGWISVQGASASAGCAAIPTVTATSAG